MGCLDIPNETVFTMEMTPIKFGPGATGEVAYDLKRLWPRARLVIVDDAGHDASSAGITGELIRATDQFASRGE